MNIGLSELIVIRMIVLMLCVPAALVAAFMVFLSKWKRKSGNDDPS